MKLVKQNLNKILLLIIYIVMFYGVANLCKNIFKDIVIQNNAQLLYSTSVNISIYGILLISGIILLKKEIVTDFKTLYKTDAMRTFLICVVGIICVYIGNLLGSSITTILGGADSSQNQEGIEELLLSKYGVFIILDLAIVGPIVEELVFRKSMHDILRSFKCPTWVMLIISSVLFGLIHVIDSGDFVQVFPYILMGVTLGGIEIYSKNIYPSIFVHIFINTIATGMIIFMSMLENAGFPMGV